MPWQALLAEVLLQRTRAGNVLPVYNKIILDYENLHDLAGLTEDEIETLIYPLGLKWRAKFLKRLIAELNNRNGVVPNQPNDLLGLPGVGPYATAAYLSFHGNKRGLIIDSNTTRFFCRLVGEICDAETRRKKWMFSTINSITPKKNWKSFNYSLLDFSMLICTKIPKCKSCPVLSLCKYGTETVNV